MRSWMFLPSLGLLAGAFVSGCATSKPQPRTQTPSIAAAPRSADELLQEGQAHQRAQAWGAASRAYAQTLEAKPSPTQRNQALDALAAVRRAMGDCSGANRALSTLLDVGAAELSVQARQRLLFERGICDAELGQWDTSEQDFGQALALPQAPTLARRMELHARRGLALFHLDRLDDAQHELQAGLDHFSSLDSDVRERLGDPYFVAMAHFYLGAIAHRRFRDITLHLPETRMARELEQKAELLAKLQEHYHNAIRQRHVFWVSAAGFQLGSAFETFYDEMMQSPVPKALSPTQRAVFYTELKKKIRPVLLRAVKVYENNLAAAQRLGYTTAFVEDTKARLAQLQHYLVSDHATGPFLPPPLAARQRSTTQQPGETAALTFVPTLTPL